MILIKKFSPIYIYRLVDESTSLFFFTIYFILYSYAIFCILFLILKVIKALDFRFLPFYIFTPNRSTYTYIIS